MAAVEPTKTEDLINPHMSVAKKAQIERDKEIAAYRDGMIKRNEESMAALAKEVPSPTPAEIQRALSGRAAKSEVNVVESTINTDSDTDKKDGDDNKVTKTSTASTDQQGGKYKTRDMNAKK